MCPGRSTSSAPGDPDHRSYGDSRHRQGALPKAGHSIIVVGASGGVGTLALTGGKALTRCIDAVRRGGRVAYPNGVEPQPRRRAGIEVVSYDAVANRHEWRGHVLGKIVLRIRDLERA